MRFLPLVSAVERVLSVAESFTLKYQLILAELMSLSVDPPPCFQVCLAHRNYETISSFRLSLNSWGKNSFDIA